MERILLGHGSGGRVAHELVEGTIVAALGDEILLSLEDSATMDFSGRMAFTTDSYVVSPLFFPGGDIGKLAICGTVNDLSMAGAEPLYLSLAFIIEEGFLAEDLKRILQSISATAKASGVRIVTGDTKVVHRGKADGLFINTAGVGRVRDGVAISAGSARPGDLVLLSGGIAEHGIAVISEREGLSFGTKVQSDCAPLNSLVAAMLDVSTNIRVLRDPTRGGVASTLNEIVFRSKCGIRLQEQAIPLREDVVAACDMLGFDPMYVANEGKLVAVVPPEVAKEMLAAMRNHPLGAHAAIIGEVTREDAGKVLMTTALGTTRLVDMLSGDQLPRIC